MEDYKKKYEELVKHIKHFHQSVNPEWKRTIESYVPELKKSEDDKIREWIINYLEVRLPDAGEFLDEYVSAIDWLKRKGEHNEADDKIKNNLIEAIEGSAQFVYCLQKHGFDKDAILSWLKRKGVQKSVEWSDEDEKIYEDIVDTVDNDLSLYWKHRNWIRNIKYRIQPQPVKLSAEDAKMIDDIINDIDIAYERAQIEQLKDIYSKEIDLLKRIKEQGYWKPDDLDKLK